MEVEGTPAGAPSAWWSVDFDAAEAMEKEEAAKAAALYEKIVGEEGEESDEFVRVKEAAIYKLGAHLADTKRGDALASLVRGTRGFLDKVSKAKAAKLVRTLTGYFLEIPSAAAVASDLCEEFITWATAEKRSYLRQALEARLVGLHLETSNYSAAIKLIAPLLKELKKLDDKALLVEVQLLESKAFHSLSNVAKAKAALTAARTAATAIYCPPALQAALDMQSGILLAEEQDFKTAYSYFYESFEGFDSTGVKSRALFALKYMLLCKVILGQSDDIAAIMQGKLALKYAGTELDALRGVAKAHSDRSLKEFERTLKDFQAELSDDPIIKAHLSALYDTLLEKNLLRLIEPFSKVEIAHVAELIELPLAKVELKLSQMILDKTLNGILDQGAGCLIIFDVAAADETYDASLNTIRSMEKVVGALYKRANKLTS